MGCVTVIYFLSYGKQRFPRQYFSDLDKAKSTARYYRDLGAIDVQLRRGSERYALQVASRWVAHWGSDPTVREQRQQQANEIRQLARSEVAIALSDPTALIGRKLSHEQAVCAGHIFR